MADPEENVSLNEDETLGDSRDEDTTCTLNDGQNEDAAKTFKDLVGLRKPGKRHRHFIRTK